MVRDTIHERNGIGVRSWVPSSTTFIIYDLLPYRSKLFLLSCSVYAVKREIVSMLGFGGDS